MKVLFKTPSESWKLIECDNTLEALHALIGGYVEAHRIRPDTFLLCDEEAKLKGSPPCAMIPVQARPYEFCGNLVMCGIDEDDASFTDIVPAVAERLAGVK